MLRKDGQNTKTLRRKFCDGKEMNECLEKLNRKRENSSRKFEK